MEENKLRPKNYENMGYALKSYYDKLDAYLAPLVKEKLMHDNVMTGPEYEEAFTELKKYVALARHTCLHLAMTSKTIDELWHQFILFTPEYHDFSNEFYGSYFHHFPNIPSRPGKPGALENLVKAYETTFGDIPKIWEIEKR